jgi:hypothetical protein
MLAVALVGTACARGVQPGPHGPPAVDRRDEVERLMRAGCYECLRDALALVDQGHAVERRFELLAVLASRVRELGLRDEVDWLAAATSVAAPGDAREALIVTIAGQARQPQGGHVFDQPEVAPDWREEIGKAVSTVWPVEPADPVDRFFLLSVLLPWAKRRCSVICGPRAAASTPRPWLACSPPSPGSRRFTISPRPRH